MSKREPYSHLEVLHAWLETVEGPSKSASPRSYAKGSSSGAWQDTCRRAAAIVESLPAYIILRWRFIEHLHGALKLNPQDKELVNIGLDQLEKYLLHNPFFPTTAKDMADEARTPVVMRTVEDVAEELGVKPDALRMRLNRLDISLPHGTYRDDKRKWHIHPYDVIFLKKCKNVENIQEPVAS